MARDGPDQRLNAAWREMARMEMEAWEAAIKTLRIRFPNDRVEHLSNGVQHLRGSSREASELKIQLEQRRRATASAARPVIAGHMERLDYLRRSLRTLVADAETARGSLTIAEARVIRKEINVMLADAKLGSIDVAWKARENAISSGREAASRESRELHSLEDLYTSLERALEVAERSYDDGRERSAHLGERVEAVSTALERQLQVYNQKRGSSEGLKRQLHHDLERDLQAASDSMATLVIEAQEHLLGQGLRLVRQEYYVNGRPLQHADVPEALRFLQPGAYQVDVLLTYQDDEGAERRIRGSFYGLLGAGNQYALTIAPKGNQDPRLRFVLTSRGGVR